MAKANATFRSMVPNKMKKEWIKGTVDLQECLPENRSYEHRLR